MLLQFPPTRERDDGALDAFLGCLPPGLPVALEFRHESWLAPEVEERIAAAGGTVCVGGDRRAPCCRGCPRARSPTCACARTATRPRPATAGATCSSARPPTGPVYAFAKHEGLEAGDPFGGVGLAEWLARPRDRCRRERHAARQPGRSDLELAADAPDGFRAGRLRIGRLLGARRTGASLYEIPPGQAVCPYHYEYGEEEWVLVLEGHPTLRTPDGTERLDPLDIAFFPTGPEGAHQIRNDTDGNRAGADVVGGRVPRRQRLPGQRQGRRLERGRRGGPDRAALGRGGLLRRRDLSVRRGFAEPDDPTLMQRPRAASGA